MWEWMNMEILVKLVKQVEGIDSVIGIQHIKLIVFNSCRLKHHSQRSVDWTFEGYLRRSSFRECNDTEAKRRTVEWGAVSAQFNLRPSIEC